MRNLGVTIVAMTTALALLICGCESKREKKRKVTIEGPEKKTEVEVKTTEKKD
jgi:hypothetical protein